MGRLSHYESCTSCGSRDNLAVYITDSGEVENKYCYTPNCTYRYRASLPSWPRGKHHALPDRGLTLDTVTKYDVGSSGGTYVHHLPYYDDNNVVAIEHRDYRWHKREALHFATEGSNRTTWFGKQAVHTKNIIAIAFGCYDAMSVYQATGIPCISTSDSRLKLCVQKHYQWLTGFSKIVILPDRDAACRAALTQVEDMLPRSTTYVASLSYKDPNEYIMRGQSSLLKQAFYSAMPMAGNLFVSDMGALLAAPTTSIGTLSGTHIDKYLRGFRAGETTVVMGSPSVGKTTYSRHLLASFLKSHVSCALISAEEGATKFVPKLANAIVQRMRTKEDMIPLTQLLDERLKVYSKDDYDADSIRAFIVTACRAFGSKMILVDNISAIARSEMLNADVGNYMKLFNALAKELQCHIIIISHTSRTVNVDSSTMDATALMQLGFGSSAIEKFAWNVILLQRKPRDLTATVQVLKNREIGPKGCGKFLTAYDDNSWTLVEAPVVSSYAGDSTVNVSVNTVG